MVFLLQVLKLQSKVDRHEASAYASVHTKRKRQRERERERESDLLEKHKNE